MTTQSSFWLVLTACIGGFIVLVGIVLEVLADKKWFKNVKAFRFWNGVKFWGEILVIVGIAIEVVDAGIAANDGWQTRQMVIKNKPRGLILTEQRGFESMVSLIADKPPIRIFLNEQVPDAEIIGNQLATVFVRAGFRFNGFVNGESFGNSRGILVGEFGETNLAAVSKIVESLKWCGLVAATNEGSSGFPKEIFVDIENK